MPPSDPHAPAALAERLQHLEILFTHLEQRVQALHDVLLSANARIDSLERQLRGVAVQYQNLEGRMQEPRDLLDEKPPHY